MSDIARRAPDSRIATLRGMLEQAKPRIAAVLPKHLTADRMCKLALVAASQSPQLAACEPVSVIRSVMLSAQLGLDPFGALGSAYLVPYGTRCTLIPGYRGLIDLARRSGAVSVVEARAVYEGDRFSYCYGLEPRLEHSPASGERDEAIKPSHVYAIVRYKDGGAQFDVMTRAEVDAIRKRSKASGNGPWVTDYAEMAKKTVIRRLLKLVPMSIELAQAIAVDERADRGEDQADGIVDVMPEDFMEKPPDGNAALKDALKAATQATLDAVPEPGAGG